MTEIRELLAFFDSQHVAKLGERAIIQPGKDAKLLALLVASHGAPRVQELIAAFFASDDEFLAQAGYTVGVFVSQAGKLIAQERLGRIGTRGGPALREARAALEALDGRIDHDTGADDTADRGARAPGARDARDQDRPGGLRRLR